MGMRNKGIAVLGVLLCWLVLAPTAAHADAFVAPTLGNLIKTLIRFGALNIRDDNVINDYAVVNECKVYKYFVGDDFKWHDVQTAIRKSIRQDVEIFPTAFYYDATMQLDRYDFTQKIYRFATTNGRQAINAFQLVSRSDAVCPDARLKAMPEEFNFVLDRSIQFPGIPLDEAQAKELLHHMEDSGNKDRVVYVRFKMKIVYIAPILRGDDYRGGTPHYKQSDNTRNARIDSRLDSVEFYEDEARTKQIIKYTP